MTTTPPRRSNPLHHDFRHWLPILTPDCDGSNWRRSGAPHPRSCSPQKPNAGLPKRCCAPWSKPNWPPAMPPTSSTGSRLGFPVPKTLESFDVAASSIQPKVFDYLSSLEWVRAQANLAIIGPAGTGNHTP